MNSWIIVLVRLCAIDAMPQILRPGNYTPRRVFLCNSTVWFNILFIWYYNGFLGISDILGILDGVLLKAVLFAFCVEYCSLKKVHHHWCGAGDVGCSEFHISKRYTESPILKTSWMPPREKHLKAIKIWIRFSSWEIICDKNR